MRPELHNIERPSFLTRLYNLFFIFGFSCGCMGGGLAIYQYKASEETELDNDTTVSGILKSATRRLHDMMVGQA